MGGIGGYTDPDRESYCRDILREEMKEVSTNNKPTNRLDKRLFSQQILATDMSDDLKLFEIFKIYNEDLQKDYSQLYYALLGWKDTHLKELLKEKSLFK